VATPSFEEIKPLAHQKVLRSFVSDGEYFDGGGENPKGPPWPSQEALALAFHDRYGATHRYCAQWGRWIVWTGQRWAVDLTLKTEYAVRALCRQASSELDTVHLARKVASHHTVKAVELLSRADQRLAVTPDMFDSEPFLLNTPQGVVDLKTGRVYDHDPEHYHMRMTEVGLDFAPTGCDRWLAFLDQITDTEDALIAYLQRVAGYILTGETSQHALFFGYGTGANGKSVFLNTICGILGDYATTAPADVFLASRHERHPTELADLYGMRLVAAAELDQDRRWSESRIKQFTGGEKIKARKMRQDFFEFTPRFKIFMAGNHKPRFDAVDEAIRRRLHLIPFSVTIASGDRDPDLFDALKKERAAILAWMISGCRDYLQYGLEPPQAVVDATDTYLEEEDMMALWLAENCDQDPICSKSTTELFHDFEAWCRSSNERTGSIKSFSQKLEGKGYRKERMAGTGRMGFRGLRLKAGVKIDETPNDGIKPEDF
jgi:putative DNA primase/helicase